MASVHVMISQYVDESQPGWVECQLTDAHGTTWAFVEKVPILTAEDLDAGSHYPRSGAIACRIMERRREASGREVVVIDTESPWGVAATSGQTRFEVLPDQVSTLEPA